MTIKRTKHSVATGGTENSTEVVNTVRASGLTEKALAQAEKKLAQTKAKVNKLMATAKDKAIQKSARIIERAQIRVSKLEQKALSRKLAIAEKAKKKAERVQKSAAEVVAREKKQYKVRNWKEYNESLRQRGRISLYLSPELLSEWHKVSKKK